MNTNKNLNSPFQKGFIALTALSLIFFMSTSLFAQFPGVETEDPKEKAVETAKKEVAPLQTSTTNIPKDGYAKFMQDYMGPESPYRPVILSVLTLLVLLNLKMYFTRKIKKQLYEKAFHQKNADTFLKTWKRVWNFAITILVLIAMSGSLKLLGLTAGFLGMMLGWSLQQPVTGLAAWLMIILIKPFRIGDRVIIAGMTGDITGITLTHVILNQVGGSIGGEERSGRGILIPNAILFQHTIINYTLEQKFMLDEVPVRITFDSDWELAKKIMIQVASDVTKEHIQEAGGEPFVRVEFLDWGLLARLRYNTIPVRRQEISTVIIEKLLQEFKKAYPKIKFAVPASHIKYELQGSEQLLPVDESSI